MKQRIVILILLGSLLCLSVARMGQIVKHAKQRERINSIIDSITNADNVARIEKKLQAKDAELFIGTNITESTHRIVISQSFDYVAASNLWITEGYCELCGSSFTPCYCAPCYDE